MGTGKKNQGTKLATLLCFAVASLGCTSLSTLVREERFDDFCRECEDVDVSDAESQEAALAFARKADLHFSARLIGAQELDERFGIPREAAPLVQFFELRWRVQTSLVGAVETDVVFAGGGRPSTFLHRLYERNLPAPVAFEPLAALPAYSVREYQPETPRPAPRFRSNGVVNAVARGLTLGHSGNNGRRLTSASRRAIERWEAANRAPREAWDAEERRLREEREAEREQLAATNEERARRRAAFEESRAALMNTIETRECARLESDGECVEVVAMTTELAQTPTTTTVSLSREYEEFPPCTLRVLYEGGPAPSLDGVQGEVQPVGVETRHFP